MDETAAAGAEPAPSLRRLRRGAGLCRGTVRGEPCGRPAVPGKPLCSKHLRASLDRGRRARDEAELSRLEAARAAEEGATGPRAGSVSYGDGSSSFEASGLPGTGRTVAGAGVDVAELEARWWTGSEILAKLAQDKYQEVLRLREAANAGALLIVELTESESDIRGRDRKVKQTPALQQAWTAERDLVRMLSVSVGADLEEASIRSKLRTNKEYLTDIREAMMLARSFPDVGVDQLIREQASASRRKLQESA